MAFRMSRRKCVSLPAKAKLPGPAGVGGRATGLRIWPWMVRAVVPLSLGVKEANPTSTGLTSGAQSKVTTRVLLLSGLSTVLNCVFGAFLPAEGFEPGD